MLSERSKCIKCLNKRICKHYEQYNSNTSIEITVDNCEDIKLETKLEETPLLDYKNKSIGIGTIKTEPLVGDKIIAPKPFKWGDSIGSYPDIYKATGDVTIGATFDCSKSTGIETFPVNISKAKCTVCGKEVFSTDIQNCSDCGIAICPECGYTNVDVNDGKPIITCDKCFTGSKEETKTVEWDLDNFIDSNTESPKEVKEDVKTNNRKSSKKSKTK